ncbi:hypothetical protein [Nocardioides currus]|uniref:Uncharacterized protein n=1 Tax=Nocardioides currus TaxID=2133958 RepID=A0A2R7Z107_9ACTN|nr:hypothetical protein [Nocardioides currus]PUA82290.1 hypothetical protein C7S10_00570 [Nocardioides currus]
MLSRGNLKRTVAGVVAGLLVGGAVTTMTPAGAEVSHQAATNWNKIWKKKLAPKADQRYYKKTETDAKYSTKAEVGSALANYWTKTQSDGAYQPKGSYAPAGSSYTKSESDARYTAAGSGYTKTESDARYAPKPTVLRGYFNLLDNVPAGGYVGGSISYGVTLTAAPILHTIAPGAVPPAGCSGTVGAPSASPGHLCIFQRYTSGGTTFNVFGGATTFGAYINATSAAAQLLEVSGTWAVGVSTLATGKPDASGDESARPMTAVQ